MGQGADRSPEDALRYPMEPLIHAMACCGLLLMAVPLAYPLLSWARWRLSRKVRRASRASPIPPVSVIVVGHNEAAHARSRIEALLSDPDLSSDAEVIVVCGGSSDGMERIVAALGHDVRLRLMIHERRVAKTEGVNAAVAASRHDVLFFCDWRQRWDPGTIGKLVMALEAPDAGVATARLVDDANGAEPSRFRRMLEAVNAWDSADGGCMNVFGACYAARRECFRPFPSDILFDDLYTVASIHAQRRTIVQVPEAVFHDIRLDRYYGTERIMRLTRGLLLFLHRHWRLVLRMPAGRATRFLHAKYSKLLIPYGFIMCLPMMVLLAGRCPLGATLCLALGLTFLLFKHVRSSAAAAFRYCCAVPIAVARYLFAFDRSVTWQKLRWQ